MIPKTFPSGVLLFVLVIFSSALTAHGQLEVSTGGSVGVGTTTPAAKLEVVDLTATSGSISRWTRNGKTLDLYTGSTVDLQLGTSGNHSLGFYTNNNNPLLTLSAAQNLGIGTTTPWSTLQVVGAASEPTLTHQTKAMQSWNWLSGSQLDLTISNASPYTISFQTKYTLGSGTTYPLALNPLGGNVGIGTKTPLSPLHVKSFIAPTSGGQTVLVLEANPAGANAGPRIDFSDGVTVLAKIREVYDAGQGALAFHTYYLGDGERMRISAQGNVGIGTTNPGYKLEVAGTVRATSFVSNTATYADFVFAPGYRLAPLYEVEAHIKEHGHLAGIPSEAEAKTRGVDLAEMQVKLLQKVEELTLHAIAQEKEIAALRQELAELKER